MAALCSDIKARCAIQPIAVGDCDRRHFQLCSSFYQRFWLRGPIEKTEGAGRVEFDVLVVPRSRSGCACLSGGSVGIVRMANGCSWRVRVGNREASHSTPQVATPVAYNREPANRLPICLWNQLPAHPTLQGSTRL